jgi:hypothetical protein
VSVIRESVLDELDVDVFACLSWKVILDTPRFGTKGIGWVIPTDPPETLPGAAEYAMAKSTFKPINCAFAGEASKRNRDIKQQDKQSLIKGFVLLSIRGVNKNLEIKPDAKTHYVASYVVFLSF